MIFDYTGVAVFNLGPRARKPERFWSMKTKEQSKESTTRLFAANLRRAMDLNSMNAMNIARKANVSPSMITIILKETGNPSISTVDIIAEAFGFEGWWMCSPYFNPGISQREINELFATLTESGETIKATVAFAKYQATLDPDTTS